MLPGAILNGNCKVHSFATVVSFLILIRLSSEKVLSVLSVSGMPFHIDMYMIINNVFDLLPIR